MSVSAEQQYEPESNQKYSLEALQNMVLPEVLPKLQDILSLNWRGRGGIPASSAVGAQTDKQGNPLITISLIFKRYIHEDTLPYKDVHKEFQIYSEVAQECLI